ncbi:esterase-like activity of phytase family protein [uncultured Jannaschia sp.]|uniref:esterase-like activity of phytase family protein n=1 Tax=uncultured Jannaschia sp. TaxID=293347 RepID=UPI002619B30D|nr:esterase-like activity of phytase family protein [uncultured Jannaschia sp.]
MRLRTLCALALIAGPASAADYLGSHTWRPEWHGAGGFSALWLDADGAGFVVLSDRGAWVRGRLSRDAAGAVAGVAVDDRGPLLRSTGDDLRGLERDAEGIARAGDAFYVSYEGVHRVMRHSDIAGAPERFEQPDAFEGLQDNSGLEALAADAEGRLYAIPERSGALDRPFPVWRFDAAGWAVAFDLPRDGRYLVAGADVGPDGRLYVLERDFALIGFRSRVRSFDLDGGDARTEIESGLAAHDNLEGISVWRDATDRLRVTLISDDNLRAVQRTEFVDYVLD